MSGRALSAASQAGLWILLGLFAWQGLTDRETGGLDPVQDHVITWSFSRQIEQTGVYPAEFLYPLPAVVMKLVLGWPGAAVSSVLWMGLMLASLWACLRALLRLLQRESYPQRHFFSLLCVLAVVYFVQWDFRAMNANTVFLALLLWSLVWAGRGRPAAAGFLLASSVALKLYSAVLLPVLLWRRRWREATFAGLGLVFWFALVPALYFGPAEAFALTRSWLGVLFGTARPGFVPELIAYKVSLEHVVHGLLVDAPETARMLTRGLQAGWAFAIAIWLVRQGRGVGDCGAGVAELARASVLCLAMLIASPMLEPHHGVLLLMPAALMLHFVFDAGQTPALRRGLAAILAASFLAIELAPSGVGKGVAVNATLIGFSLATVALYPRVPRPAAG